MDSYLGLMSAHNYLLDLLATQVSHLPEPEREELRQAQRDYVGEWTRLLEMLDPSGGGTEARIRVQATLTVINGTARTPHLATALGYADATRIVTRSLLSGTWPAPWLRFSSTTCMAGPLLTFAWGRNSIGTVTAGREPQ